MVIRDLGLPGGGIEFGVYGIFLGGFRWFLPLVSEGPPHIALKEALKSPIIETIERNRRGVA